MAAVEGLRMRMKRKGFPSQHQERRLREANVISSWKSFREWEAALLQRARLGREQLLLTEGEAVQAWVPQSASLGQG